jgi:hypothetical protein
MFRCLNEETRRHLVSFCCAGMHCQGDKPDKVFYNFVPALDDVEGKIVVWLRLGRDEAYVMNPERPANGEGMWRVIEELRAR